MRMINSEAYGGFRCRYYDYEKNENLSVKAIPRLAEGDEGQVNGVEHQLDGHEDSDDVAAEDEGHDAEAEQDGAEGQVVVRRDHA